jgi:hypothetical protein
MIIQIYHRIIAQSAHNETAKMSKEVVVVYFEVLVWNLPAGAEKNHRKSKSEKLDYV